MTLRNVWSPQRRNRRDVDVYLPSSYARGRRRYPVVYMQDGQNLSDPSIAFAGTWDLHRVLARLALRGIEPIVVGVHNVETRLAEYSPFPDRKHGGGEADAYLSFLIGTLKPRIDRMFRTRRQASHTAIFGSSMGGLISLYAWFRAPNAFGMAGAMSPALWYGRQRLFDFLESARVPRGRLYVDVGTAEGATTLADARAFRSLAAAKGLRVGDRFSYVEESGARHQEAYWSARLGEALEFLLVTVSNPASPRTRA